MRILEQQVMDYSVKFVSCWLADNKESCFVRAHHRKICRLKLFVPNTSRWGLSTDKVYAQARKSQLVTAILHCRKDSPLVIAYLLYTKNSLLAKVYLTCRKDNLRITSNFTYGKDIEQIVY